jgi:hypothetical protein
VFLAPGATISFSVNYSPFYSGPVANITCDDPTSYLDNPTLATKFLSATDSGSINKVKEDYFLFNGAQVSIMTGSKVGDYFYGYYNGSPP